MWRDEGHETKAEKRKNLGTAHNDIRELEAEGFQVRKMTPFHWRITKKPDYTFEVDVWPSTLKAQEYESRILHRYTDLYTFITKLFGEHMP